MDPPSCHPHRRVVYWRGHRSRSASFLDLPRADHSYGLSLHGCCWTRTSHDAPNLVSTSTHGTRYTARGQRHQRVHPSRSHGSRWLFDIAPRPGFPNYLASVEYGVPGFNSCYHRRDYQRTLRRYRVRPLGTRDNVAVVRFAVCIGGSDAWRPRGRLRLQASHLGTYFPERE